MRGQECEHERTLLCMIESAVVAPRRGSIKAGFHSRGILFQFPSDA